MAEKYLDLHHAGIMAKFHECFKEFNQAIVDADPGGMAWVPEVMVKFDDEDYCKIFYLDEEVFVEPIYNPVRSIEDR